MAKEVKQYEGTSLLDKVRRFDEERNRIIRETIDKIAVGTQRLFDLDPEFRDQTDRGVGILGAALLESELRGFIIAHLTNSTKATRVLFDRGQALESFGTQITLAYAIGLVNEDVYEDLDCIREIRNACAHSIWYVPKKGKGKGQPQGLVTFEQEHLKAMALSLRCYKMTGIDEWQEQQEHDIRRQSPEAKIAQPNLRTNPRARYEQTCQCLHMLLLTYSNTPTLRAISHTPAISLPLGYTRLNLPPIPVHPGPR